MEHRNHVLMIVGTVVLKLRFPDDMLVVMVRRRRMRTRTRTRGRRLITLRRNFHSVDLDRNVSAGIG